MYIALLCQTISQGMLNISVQTAETMMNPLDLSHGYRNAPNASLCESIHITKSLDPQ